MPFLEGKEETTVVVVEAKVEVQEPCLVGKVAKLVEMEELVYSL